MDKGYHKLIVWQKSHALTLAIYRATSRFPKEEQYDLTSQIRRSAKSVSANIVEGHASCSKNIFLRYLDQANASLVETEYHLELARDLEYLVELEYKKLDLLRTEVGALLHSFMATLRKNR